MAGPTKTEEVSILFTIDGSLGTSVKFMKVLGKMLTSAKTTVIPWRVPKSSRTKITKITLVFYTSIFRKEVLIEHSSNDVRPWSRKTMIPFS